MSLDPILFHSNATVGFFGTDRETMDARIFSVIAMFISLQLPVTLCSPQSCPDFTATFVGMIDQTVDFVAIPSDPEMTFFKKDMGLRDDDIQHIFEDVTKFYNETYGLDFSNSPPNEQNEYMFENAKLSLFHSHEDDHYQLILNNWIQTGNTRTTCRDIHRGGYRVTFTGDQLLHGSYGGVKGKPAGVENIIQYGYDIIDVCEQSPVIVQFQNASPFRMEPVDGIYFANYDTYNQVLGYGKALGLSSLKPDKDSPGKFRLVFRLVYTF